MDKLKPMLFTVMKGYTKEQFVKDVVAGIIVAIIALPLSIALALASGVGPEQGIYTAIIAGFIISFLGGSSVQIAGPTAAFATIVAGIVAENGMSGLATATILAGIILIVMGLLRFGSLIKFIPYTITVGFTAGIAVTIVIGQLKDFFGITYAQGTQAVETMEKLKADVAFAGTVNWQAVIVGVVCLAVLIVWPKIGEKIPGSLIAVIVGIVMVKGIGMHVNTIGDLYTISNALPKPVMPDFSLETVGRMLPDAFTIAILAAIESLLSCVVADGMVNSRHRSNMELVAQGAGNIGSALFGGIPATGAIARTAIAPFFPFATRFVPSTGSTAISTSSPPCPTCSPMYSMGASSISPSPMTTVPETGVKANCSCMPSTAAWSAPSLSPNPTSRALFNAACSVIRANSNDNCLSITASIIAHYLPS